MLPQPTQRDAERVNQNPTARAERAADETLDRIIRAREDADTPDDAAAEQAWRLIARLGSRLHQQAHAIVVALEGGAAAQRELVEASLRQCPDRPTAKHIR